MQVVNSIIESWDINRNLQSTKIFKMFCTRREEEVRYHSDEPVMYHDPELIEAVEVEPANHGSAILHAIRLPQPGEHPHQARRLFFVRCRRVHPGCLFWNLAQHFLQTLTTDWKTKDERLRPETINLQKSQSIHRHSVKFTQTETNIMLVCVFFFQEKDFWLSKKTFLHSIIPTLKKPSTMAFENTR
jgi:hypothetical protein